MSSAQLPPGETKPVRSLRRRFTVRRTRVGGWWVALVAGTLVLLLLLIFVLQNGQQVQISFLGLSGVLPLGVAMLLAAIGGIVAVAIPGTGRILQLRRAAQQEVAGRSPAPPAEPAQPPTPEIHKNAPQ